MSYDWNRLVNIQNSASQQIPFLIPHSRILTAFGAVIGKGYLINPSAGFFHRAFPCLFPIRSYFYEIACMKLSLGTDLYRHLPIGAYLRQGPPGEHNFLNLILFPGIYIFHSPRQIRLYILFFLFLQLFHFFIYLCHLFLQNVHGLLNRTLIQYSQNLPLFHRFSCLYPDLFYLNPGWERNCLSLPILQRPFPRHFLNEAPFLYRRCLHGYGFHRVLICFQQKRLVRPHQKRPNTDSHGHTSQNRPN